MFCASNNCAGHENVSVVWLIATVGLKSFPIHRLSRHQINKLSISELCKLILTDYIPLRLSATLLYGVLLIFESQSKNLLADVKSAKEKLKLFNSVSTLSIDMST